MDHIDPINKEQIEIDSAMLQKFHWIRRQQAIAGDMPDDDWVKLIMTIRDNYSIRWGAGSTKGKTDKMGAYSQFVLRALEALELHYRIVEARARVRALQEPMREFVNLTKSKREEARGRVLKLVEKTG